ncbi:gene transfer agent family protein [Methylobacterium organophilum]|uniref:gene transfer agent family protein n=1 Tax=Methylobacterium organophilum TaxID=410 RepID=UPI001F133352|nr:gene transfer agent family protein [Methylobacterium organophilum]UMY18557.1 gene transfer agent family protein [Methylobacterium organophilum]
MANRRRGEVPLVLGHERYTLCLTLGALAELEEAFQAADAVALAGRLAEGRLRSRDLIILLGAALRGGGHALDDRAVAALPLASGLDAIVRALGEAVEAAFGTAEDAPRP